MKDNFYHILNRGVEKRKIFLNKDDYLRFTHNLRDFNDSKNVLPYRDRNHSIQEVAPPVRGRFLREKLVDVLLWCLIPNHFHIDVQEQIEGDASIYAQKLTGGYTMYFNPKNQRNGVLFQGRSKIIQIERDAHFLHLPFYIFSNPIKLIEPKWKENGIKNFKKVMEFLENYKWSSFPDLIGKDNFPKIINKKLFYEIYDTDEKRFKKDFIEWLTGFTGGRTSCNEIKRKKRGFEKFD